MAIVTCPELPRTARSVAVRFFLRAAALAILAGGVVPAHAEERYTMDPFHSIPEFRFQHLGLTTQTGRFDRAGGSIVLDRAARKGSIDYEVDSSSLNMGFGTESPDSPGFRLFKVAAFPSIVYRSDELYFDAAGNVVAAAGQLTLLGVTRPLKVWVSRFKCSENPMNKKPMCAANIEATVIRSEFGMLDYIPGISDEIKVIIPVEAYRN